MKNLIKLTFISLLIIFAAQSCKKDSFSEIELVDALTEYEKIRDSLLNSSGRVVYTVHVVDGGRSAFAKAIGDDADDSEIATVGVTGVQVTAAQFGEIVTMTTDSDGMVVFSDFRIGKVNVNVDVNGFTSVAFVAELTPSDLPLGTYNWNTIRYAATKIPVFPLTGNGTATISGIVTHESDLTNAAREPVSGMGVSASINTGGGFLATYINTGGASLPGTGQVISVTYGDAIASSVTSGAGQYSLTVPGTANGLPIQLHLSDVVTNQTLLVETLNGIPVFGPQSIRTTFSQTAGFAPSTIPAVRPAYVEFSLPEGDGINQAPTTAAAATAVISNGQIKSVNVTNAGNDYTQTPLVEFTSTFGTGATAVAVLTGGRVTAINVTNPGQGYTNAFVSLTNTGADDAAVSTVISYGVTEVNVTTAGTNYSGAPTVQFSGGNGGSGASAVANISGYINMINVSNAGINFTETPIVQLVGGGGTGATATAVLGTGPIRTITVPFTANAWFTAAPAVTFVGADGSDAIATANLATTGRLAGINVTNAGINYTSPPVVSISGGGGSGAVAVAILGAGGTIASIELVNQGSGYSTNPTITVTGGGGSAATAEVTNIERRIASVTINQGGHSYTDATTGNNVQFDGATIAGTIVLLNRSITTINVTNPGSDYNLPPTVQIVGDGSGAVASAQLRFTVSSFTVTNKGSGYRTAPTIMIVGDGTGATATAVLGDGVIASVSITNPGFGYLAPPKFVLTGGGAQEQAVLTGTVSAGRLTGVTIVHPGRGYTVEPAVAINTFLTAAAANVNISSGNIVAVNVNNPGLGYKSTPLIEFVSTSGSGATAVAVLDDQGRISAINVTDQGEAYAAAPTVNIVVPNAATRARGTVTVSAAGTVTGVTVTNGGEGYASVPDVTIFPSVPGMGSGAVAEARIANGVITSVVIVNGGSNYMGKNTPGNFFPLNIAAVAGSGFSYSHPTGATLLSRSGVNLVNDVYLGTGRRDILN